MSSTAICQKSNTSPTNQSKCFDDRQLNELYKIAKQNEYLKTRASKTEQALEQSQNVISQQKDVMYKQEAFNNKNPINIGIIIFKK